MIWAVDLLTNLDAAQEPQEVFALVERAALALGFEYCAYGMRVPVPLTRPQVLMFNNYPVAWRRRYEEARYVEVDPTVRHGRISQQPLIWSDEVFSATPELWNDARDSGLRFGWAQSSLDGQSVGGMLTLARSTGPLRSRELAAREPEMRWLVSVAHQGFRRVQATRSSVQLSEREKEVLRWSADGKTSDEIAEILAIAVATVKFHTRNAGLKLGTINRTATVARAAILGLLAE